MATTKTRPRTKTRPTSAATKSASATTTKTRAPRTRAGARSSSTTTGKATSTKKSTTTGKNTKKSSTPVREPSPREFDAFGFVIGSDSSTIAHALVEGGFDRREVNDQIVATIEKTTGIETRGGGVKNVPSLVSGILGRLEEKGYTVESTWRLVPPADVTATLKKEAASAKRKATRAKR